MRAGPGRFAWHQVLHWGAEKAPAFAVVARGEKELGEGGFFARSLGEGMEREDQGAPLKPHQGPRSWSLLPKTLHLRGEKEGLLKQVGCW